MSTFRPSSSSPDPSIMGPLDFKISHPAQKYARRLHFPSPPAYSSLSFKILSLWPSASLTSHSLALDYVDREGDRVILSSDEELQAFYHEIRSGVKGNEIGVVKMRVVVLEGKKPEEGINGGGEGKKVELSALESLDLASIDLSGGLPSQGRNTQSFSAENMRQRYADDEEEMPVLIPVSVKGQKERRAQKTDTPSQANLDSAQPLRRTLSSSSSLDDIPALVTVEKVPQLALKFPKEVHAPAHVLKFTSATSTPTLNHEPTTSTFPSPSSPSLLADLTEAFNLFTTSPAFTAILDQVAQGHYTQSPPPVQPVVVENEPAVASKTEESLVAVDTSAASVEQEPSKPSESERGPSIVEICQAEVFKGIGEARKVLDEAGSVVGGMTSSFKSGIKELLVLKETRTVKERELREAAASAEKEKEVVVVERSQPGSVAVAVKSESLVKDPQSPVSWRPTMMLMEEKKEEPTAKFGEQSVVGRGGLPLPKTPPGQGFARFYGGQPLPQQSSFSSSYQDTGSFMAKWDGQEK